MTEIDFQVVEGEGAQPQYDSSTNEIVQGKERRDADVHETVRAAVMQQTAAKDPVEKYRQLAEKNGTNLPAVLGRMHEFDQITDPVERLSFVNRAHGVNDQAAASELYLRSVGQSNQRPSDAPTESQQNAIRDFDLKHNDPISKSLRPEAIKVLQSGDKRLEGCRSDTELLDRAFGIAWHNKNPQARAQRGVAEKFVERDAARENAVRISKKIASHIG